MPWRYECYYCNRMDDMDPFGADPFRECPHCHEECCDQCLDGHVEICNRNEANDDGTGMSDDEKAWIG